VSGAFSPPPAEIPQVWLAVEAANLAGHKRRPMADQTRPGFHAQIRRFFTAI
jgi:hypothetical protein